MSMAIYRWVYATALLLSAPFAMAQSSPVVFQGALSGAWYSPARSGEGMMFDISSEGARNVIFVAWFAHESKKQRWLAGSVDFPVGAKQAVIPLFVVEGTDFGNAFDPTKLTRTSWGTLTVAFTCSKLTYSYLGPVNTTGSGEYQRLISTPKDAVCR